MAMLMKRIFKLYLDNISINVVIIISIIIIFECNYIIKINKKLINNQKTKYIT